MHSVYVLIYRTSTKCHEKTMLSSHIFLTLISNEESKYMWWLCNKTMSINYPKKHTFGILK